MKKLIGYMVLVSVLFAVMVSVTLAAEEALLINHMKNEKDNNQFANDNMKVETKIFLDLDIKVPNFTCHDAVYFVDVNEKSNIEKLIKDKMVEEFGPNTNFSLDFNKNETDDNIDIVIDEIDDVKIFLFNDKIRRKETKPRSQKEININLIKKYIEQGITSNKELSIVTELSISTIKRLKPYINKK